MQAGNGEAQVVDCFDFGELSGHPCGIDFDERTVGITAEGVVLEVGVGFETVDRFDVNPAVLCVPFSGIDKVLEVKPCLVKQRILLVGYNRLGIIADIGMEGDDAQGDRQQ